MLPVCNVLRDLIKEAMKWVTSQTLDIFGPYPKKSFSKHVNIKCADNRESIAIKFNKNRIDVKCTFKKNTIKAGKEKTAPYSLSGEPKHYYVQDICGISWHTNNLCDNLSNTALDFNAHETIIYCSSPSVVQMLEFLQSSYDVIKSYLTLASVKWMQIQVFRSVWLYF